MQSYFLTGHIRNRGLARVSLTARSLDLLSPLENDQTALNLVGHQDGSEDAGDVDPAPGDKPESACILSWAIHTFSCHDTLRYKGFEANILYMDDFPNIHIRNV